MNVEPGAILLSVVTGGVGLALFLYGKKTQRLPQLIAGVLFMVYPYFVSTTWMAVVVGAVLTGGLWAALWMGY